MTLTNEAIDARVGTVVDDTYRITRLIGCGGVGCVYEAAHTVRSERVAIKIILPQYASNPESLRRCQNEAKAVSHLDHPNLAEVLDHGCAPDGSPYVVMQYLTGQNCSQLLSATGPLPIERACDIVYQACVGMSIAHQSGIVHRGIKPGNLFITPASDGSDLVKVLDFGIARLRSPGAAVRAGCEIETVSFRAPEQIRDAGKVDGRADIWSLGVVLYELLTACRPFDGADAANIAYQISFEEPEPPNELRPGLPVELVSAIALALEKDPEKRFETVLALADAIGPFTGRPPSRFSKLAVSQRPPLLTPVDAAYDTAQAGISVLTNAPVSQSVKSSRRRAYRVYTLLGVAALVGFGGGGLTRRIVNHYRSVAAAADPDYSEAPTHSEVSVVASAAAPAVAPAITEVATDASTPIVPSAQPVTSVAAAPVLSSSQNAPMRLMRVSPDAGMVRAMVEPAPEATAAAAVASSKQAELASARTSAPKSNAAATQTTAPVPARSELESAPSNANDTENPL